MGKPGTAKAGERSVDRLHWMSVDQAAAILGIPVLTLRRAIERNVVRAIGGGMQAQVDGIRARKFGRLWRVWLDPGWTEPAAKTG